LIDVEVVTMIGPVLPESDFLHNTKYRGGKTETYERFSHRFAHALSDSAAMYAHVLSIVQTMRFMAAGRVQSWAGSDKIVTPYNCFVSPTIHDSFVDGPNIAKWENMDSVSIMDAAKFAAQTMRQGGGIGYDFSTLRPRGALIRGVMSHSGGPIDFMPIFNAVCKATSSAGERRGAQMGVLRCDHPDITEFVTMKANSDFLNGFNVSVAVTDELMEAVARKGSFDLRFNGEVLKTVDAAELWELIMKTTWDWAEPGVLFIDTINRMNNLWYCETIAATNPCGEQPLPPYGACLLGSFAAPKYLIKDLAGYRFDWDQFIADIPVVVRMMDNVIDKANYPLAQQAVEAKNKRRMGLGITGLANALEAMGFPYGSVGFVTLETKMLNILRDHAYNASIDLAIEKGAFPLFDADKYLESGFAKTLPDEIRERIRKHGIRNSHLLSIAPTGTISFAADNMSSSIEPVFALEAERLVNMPGGQQVMNVKDYGYNFLGVKGKTTANVTLDEHLAVLLVAAAKVDSAVSKTINVDKHVKWDDFKNVYLRAYEGGAKGCTTFNKDGLRMGILVDKDEQSPSDEQAPAAPAVADTCTWDPTTGRRSCE
jgi:ribonucleoside-diphosphate reductase alpha chain